MKRLSHFFLVIILTALLAACGESNVNNETDLSETEPENNELYDENEADGGNEEIGNEVEETEEFNEVNEPEE